MECINCKNAITPGTEIVVDELLADRAHCPYCLQIVPAEPSLTEQTDDRRYAHRDEMRAKVRAQFVDRLLQVSADGKLHCPVCDHTLNETDQQLLRNSEYFRCHLCGHDLATVAYRQELYHEQRWLPVVFALQDQSKEEDCADCCYAGAIAEACLKAYSWMPKTNKYRGQITRIACRPHLTIPDCDWESCVAVVQYRKLAGKGHLLL